ncbi:MAG: hypothetical protein RIQ89_1597 [Bacteroidota bacterium]|jgi:16S rRNA C967 or C1407 C5-methylase (RsmB/RsmF family)/NOL1/NOP2/fmu family ribosome biogenesis protein
MEPIPLPSGFLQEHCSLPQQEKIKLAESLDKEYPIGIRKHPFKKLPFVHTTPIPWCAQGAYLLQKQNFALDPFWHAGHYYVQEPSSMVLEQVINQLSLNKNPIVALDACAAPGGKSTHLISLLHHESVLWCNEVSKSRSLILQENMVKWGFANQIITNNPVSRFKKLEQNFNLILVDAPCSGEGMFRKDRQSRLEWSGASVAHCSQRQQDILSDLMPALAPDGILIYSTCTFNEVENEGTVKWLLSNYNLGEVKINTQHLPGLEAGSYGYHCYPHKFAGEGFYFAVLQNQGGVPRTKRKEKPQSSMASHVREYVKSHFNDVTGVMSHFENFNLVNEAVLQQLRLFKDQFYFINAGIAIASQKGNRIVPHPHAAFSHQLKGDVFDCIFLDHLQALAFLRKQPIGSVESENGYKLVLHEQAHLGFINVIGTRYNNYFPDEWRLRLQ